MNRDNDARNLLDGCEAINVHLWKRVFVYVRARAWFFSYPPYLRNCRNVTEMTQMVTMIESGRGYDCRSILKNRKEAAELCVQPGVVGGSLCTLNTVPSLKCLAELRKQDCYKWFDKSFQQHELICE